MSTLDVAVQMYKNGYAPVPLDPGEKGLKIWNWQKIAGGRAVDHNGKPIDRFSIWNRAAPGANVGIYCGDLVIVVDGDAKDDAGIGITGKEVMDYLWEHHKELFSGAIMELTAGGGSHTTYRWEVTAEEVLVSIEDLKRGVRLYGPVMFPRDNTMGKTYCIFTHDEVPIIPEGIEVQIELLTRNAQSVAPPSVYKGRVYRYASTETHLNTLRKDLPLLPWFFRAANRRYVQKVKDEEEKSREKAEKERAQRRQSVLYDPAEDVISEKDKEYIAAGLTDAYVRGVVKGERHFNALGLAQSLSGHECPVPLIQSSVEDYFSRCTREAAPGEIDGIIKRALSHPDRDPPVPWRAINAGRRAAADRSREAKRRADAEKKKTDPTLSSIFNAKAQHKAREEEKTKSSFDDTDKKLSERYGGKKN